MIIELEHFFCQYYDGDHNPTRVKIALERHGLVTVDALLQHRDRDKSFAKIYSLGPIGKRLLLDTLAKFEAEQSNEGICAAIAQIATMES